MWDMNDHTSASLTGKALEDACVTLVVLKMDSALLIQTIVPQFRQRAWAEQPGKLIGPCLACGPIKCASCMDPLTARIFNGKNNYSSRKTKAKNPNQKELIIFHCNSQT